MTRVLLLACLLLVVLPAAPATAGGGCHSPDWADKAANVVTLQKNCFTPTVARIDPGETVEFRSIDPMEHMLDGAGGWGWGPIAEQDVVAFRFERPGVYPFACYLHPGMLGAVVVGDGQTVGGPGAVTPVSTGKAATNFGGARGSAAQPASADQAVTSAAADTTATTATVEPAGRSGNASLAGVGFTGGVVGALAGAGAAMAVRRRREAG